MSTILVTGGAGFIGSQMTEALVQRGHRVTVLDDLSGGFIDNLVDDAEFVHGSINDVELVNHLFERMHFDYVYHLAAYAAEGLSHFIKRFNYNNNLIGTVNLINAAINTGVNCFVFTSSIAVYGSTPELPMTEETTPHPEDPYGIAKFAAEQELKVCREIFDLNYIIFRPHNVYGERQNIGDKYRNVVGIFMNQILQGKPMTVFGDGEQTRAFSYIGDLTPIMADAITMPAAYNQIFNIGADQPYTINELAHAVARAMAV
ncbi:MAG: NAD-dependent epimerase/dehydratase family protein, partial [Caldilineaceae bacterium]|nr:NAD-dependent epimerase/dehydratase family protein [Caldilineaceae bacterium]MCB0188209.1 NAD-dependent epimerase/dehydratase family protein [Caldilineaceae bacterium]